MTWRASILTLFPEMFPGPLGYSLAGKALENGTWSLQTIQMRDFATDRHHSVDDTPFGGGAGMVLRPDVVDAALNQVADERPILCLTPRGKRFSQADAQQLARGAGADQPTHRISIGTIERCRACSAPASPQNPPDSTNVIQRVSVTS